MKALHPVVLVILDGFGHRDITDYNAIAHAQMPYFTSWCSQYPIAYLAASGKHVGLMQGAVGNSEVGHVTIGAGRIIEQPALRIHKAIADKTFFENIRVRHACEQIKHQQSTLHIIGLVSDAGVHSTLELMQASITAALNFGLTRIVVHAILDGRDTAPCSANTYLTLLENVIKKYPQVIMGSLHGRFYAMDRDHNWDRVEQAYRVLTEPLNSSISNWRTVLQSYYEQGITDEFIPPTQLHPNAVITDGDGIFFTNYRPDRARELTACFIDRTHVPFVTKDIQLASFITPVSYGVQSETTILFDRPVITNTLKEVLAQHGKRMVSVAETEKYAHVTYFFNGEKEEPVLGEARILVPSIRVKTYVEHPCMSAPEITQSVVASLQDTQADFYLINYANADMVGHSGDFVATITAIECLDRQLGVLYEQVVEKMGGTLIITADHGKAEQMFDTTTGQPYTGHTTNLVPFLVVSSDQACLQKLPTQLSEIAPFILEYMQLPVPDQMRR